jgi:hypothetical protein
MWRGTIAALFVALCWAGPAQALTRVATPRDTTPDVHLAGQRVVFAEALPHRYPETERFVVWSAGVGRAPELRARVTPLRSSDYDPIYTGMRMASWRDQLVLAREDYADTGEPIDIFRVYTRRELRALPGAASPWAHTCSIVYEPPLGFRVAMSDDAVVTTAPGCADEGLAIRSFGRGGAVLRRLEDADPRAPFDVAGFYVAYGVRGGGLAVGVWRTGQRLYSADAAAAGLSLQTDGKVAFLLSGDECGRLVAWASPREPFTHVLPHAACGQETRIAGDRIAFVREADGRRELVTSDLSGADVVPVARANARFTGFDFDGSRLAWSTPRCHDTPVYVIDVRPGSVAPAERTACPMRIARAPLRLDRDGRVRVRVRCPAGCVAHGYIEPEGEGFTTYLRRPVAIRPGSGTLVFRLPAEDRARIRRRGSVRALVEVETSRPDDRTQGDRARLTLRG